MKNRTTEDRRVKKLKVAVDNRKAKRRKEDRDNALVYYVSLSLGLFVLLVLAIFSVIGG
ncbi:MAG: hypothetical protein CFH44_00493 [Proteobacteria bacterium]|nr:MAG: hypothetical protein CFH44_00493 [Pseudomonadota bacterium]|tara:strand:- start:1531 stop:1707 length:177 start_codon:yes stop_codon:yes gene_type:complete